MATVETSSPIYAGFGGNDGMGFGGGGFIWAFLIFALLMGNGGWGGWGNGNGNSNAIQNDINRGFDSQNTMANQREILSAVSGGTAQAVAATNQVYHDLADVVRDKYGELTRDIGGIRVSQEQALANQNQCCCEQKMLVAETGAAINANIAQSRYDAAMNTAAINANTTAQMQKILDVMQQNKIESLQNRVNHLETQNMLGNVVRYPTMSTYNAGNSPFCNNGGGCGYPYYS